MIATTIFDETKHPIISKILLGGLGYSLFIGFIAIVTSSPELVYECNKKIKVVISMSILIVSMI